MRRNARASLASHPRIEASCAMLDTVRTLVRSFTRDEAYPAANVAKLVDARVFAAPFARSLGGDEVSLREAVEIVEAIAEACPGTALLASMPIGLAGGLAAAPEVAPAAHRDAARAQLDEVAADYRAGKIYAACNSEKGAGGSLAATKTVARKDATGAFALTGEKILASFGRHADVFFSTAKVAPEELPGCGVVEFFFVPSGAPGVRTLDDWNGFGMRGTESHGVRYESARASAFVGFPGYIETARPLEYWFCLFAAVPLGCAATMLRVLGSPAPASPALRLRLAEAQMRYEAARAYLLDTASAHRPGASAAYRARVLRTKTFVSQEATRLCADLFALSGGRHYVRGGALSGAMADVFAGTALRPPLAQALDMLAEGFSVDDGR
jgi:alkylation response protein AidB-like acyl-CoA dehydrogenase